LQLSTAVAIVTIVTIFFVLQLSKAVKIGWHEVASFRHGTGSEIDDSVDNGFGCVGVLRHSEHDLDSPETVRYYLGLDACPAFSVPDVDNLRNGSCDVLLSDVFGREVPVIAAVGIERGMLLVEESTA